MTGGNDSGALDDAERLRSLIECLPAVVYEVEAGPEGAWYYISPQLEALLGYSPQEWIDDPGFWLRCVHPDDRDAVVELERREEDIARKGDVTCVSEYRMVHRDGHAVWVRDEAQLTAGEPPFWRGLLTGISAERQAEHQLAEASKRYRHLINSLPGCVYRYDPTPGARWEFVSPRIEQLLGYSAEEWLADPSLWASSLHPSDHDRVLAELNDHLRNAPLESALVTEYRLLRHDGEEIWVRDRAVVTEAADGRRLLDGMLIDLAAQPGGDEAAAAPDVYRLACPSCGATWAAEATEPCRACGEDKVERVSLNATLAELAATRKRFETLLDGINRHLDVLSKREDAEPALPSGRRVVARVEEGTASEPH